MTSKCDLEVRGHFLFICFFTFLNRQIIKTDHFEIHLSDSYAKIKHQNLLNVVVLVLFLFLETVHCKKRARYDVIVNSVKIKRKSTCIWSQLRSCRYGFRLKPNTQNHFNMQVSFIDIGHKHSNNPDWHACCVRLCVCVCVCVGESLSMVKVESWLKVTSSLKKVYPFQKKNLDIWCLENSQLINVCVYKSFLSLSVDVSRIFVTAVVTMSRRSHTILGRQVLYKFICIHMHSYMCTASFLWGEVFWKVQYYL